MLKFSDKKTIKVVLVGQANVGKSMLINSISKSKLRVGNFAGVTVEKEEVLFEYKNYKIEIIDLPGTYSLNNYTLEEKVTKEYLENKNYDLILNVLDSTNLERNLYLTQELMLLEKKHLIALNMIDEAKKENIDINENKLSSILGIKCVKTAANKDIGKIELLNSIISVYENKCKKNKLIYSETIEKEIINITNYLEKNLDEKQFNLRNTAIKLLKKDENIYKELHDRSLFLQLQDILKKSFEHLFVHYESIEIDDIFNDEKVSISRGLIKQTVRENENNDHSFTSQIDKILLNKYLGLPIFLFFMWALFQFTFEIGSIPMDMIDNFFAGLMDSTKNILGDNEFSSLIADGAIAGVGAVILFVPNIVILFFGIALLETTGYMARVAFLLDGFFYKFGLHGKSFIPLVSGFGCSVPAYMAARTLKNDRDRLLTLFIIGFMSCGARLPIYILFIGAFFPQNQAANILFIIYISGALIGLFAAKILKVFVFKGEEEPFVMEMPKYRLPSPKLIYHTVSSKAYMYLKKAGTFILAASIMIWFASNYPKHLEHSNIVEIQIVNTQDKTLQKKLSDDLVLYKLENSYLGYIGKFTEPLFSPLGFDWKMTVALETGLAAKEIVVATLGILYGLGDESDENSKSLIEKIKNNIPLASAISFIVFVMIYIPCLAATVVFSKEAGARIYLVYLFLFTTIAAWILSFISYRIALLII